MGRKGERKIEIHFKELAYLRGQLVPQPGGLASLKFIGQVGRLAIQTGFIPSSPENLKVFNRSDTATHIIEDNLLYLK